MKHLLKEIVDEYGRDIYLEEKRLEGIITDKKRAVSKRFRNQIVGIMRSKCLNEIITAREIDVQRVKIIFQEVVETTGYSEIDVDELFRCIFYSVGLSYSSPLEIREHGSNFAVSKGGEGVNAGEKPAGIATAAIPAGTVKKSDSTANSVNSKRLINTNSGVAAAYPKSAQTGTAAVKRGTGFKSKAPRGTTVFGQPWFYLIFVLPGVALYFAAAFYAGILDNTASILMCLASASIFILSDVIVKDKTDYTREPISYILVNRLERHLLLLAIAGISIIYIRCL
ncbi:hypothetical protein DFR58_11371 [Anaerobacterium chartisolvens]|uniref:Uncharacterized protein n=1 Tax=Anaerobacterium chartisolvens TaxID=1297424 RepID=A0A369B1Q8_9FIRM|nr:hypothetical protein [Anaerobacterium chartisolvens]RCX15489.1 hypothetical protein DFR58_11371 [Anaerobacterium chartisolvens]